MQLPQLIYVLGSFILISYWVSKAKKKWLIAALLFWLYSQPILNDFRYMIHVSVAGIDLQPSRILFLILLISLLLLTLNANIHGKRILDLYIHKLRTHELLMLLYIGILLLSMTLNISNLGAKLVIVNFIKLSTFVLAYFIVREHASLHDFKIFAYAVVTYAVLSSLTGIYQFWVDESFFRNGVARLAFGSFSRANGFFPSEYEQGVYLTLALVIGLIMIPNRWIKATMIILLSLGMVFTFHRGSWIIFLVCLGVLIMKSVQRWTSLLLTAFLAAAVAVFVFLNMPQLKQVSGSGYDPVKGRVLENTLKPRMDYNLFALQMMLKYPLGIGDFSSDIYSREAHRFGYALEFNKGAPYIIHNGFLSAGTLYGITGMAAFIVFMLTGLMYYLQQKRGSTSFRWMAGLFLVSFLIINMTQDFSFLGSDIGLFLGILLGFVHSLNSPVVGPGRISSNNVLHLLPSTRTANETRA